MLVPFRVMNPSPSSRLRIFTPGAATLTLVRPKLVDPNDPSKLLDGANTIVAVDTVGAGEGELVMFCQGSSARQASNLKPVPVDAAVVAIIDRVDVLGKAAYRSG